MNWQLHTFNELTTLDLYNILQLRNAVFIVEQQCTYQDIDNKDLKALHLIYKTENDIIAYCRLLPPGLSYEQSSIGRVLTKASYRSKGIGKTLMQQAIRHCQTLWPKYDIVISAQLYLKGFYRNLEFKTLGQPYLEDDIPHVKMILNATLRP